MQSVKDILIAKGEIGVQALKADVEKVSATHKTANSIHFQVQSEPYIDTLIIWGRQFFSTLETGRGPRKSDTTGDFKNSMLEWMNARGIGTGLTAKKQNDLARFLVLKINREGDQTFKKGGRIVYSPTLTKLVNEIKKEVSVATTKAYSKIIIDGFKHT